MPTGFEIDREHWALIIRFIGEQAQRDGVVTEGEMVDLMRQWWGFISDKAALKARLDNDDTTQKADEIIKLKARLAELEPRP
jgi:hypothetical protein